MRLRPSRPISACGSRSGGDHQPLGHRPASSAKSGGLAWQLSIGRFASTDEVNAAVYRDSVDEAAELALTANEFEESGSSYWEGSARLPSGRGHRLVESFCRCSRGWMQGSGLLCGCCYIGRRQLASCVRMSVSQMPKFSRQRCRRRWYSEDPNTRICIGECCTLSSMRSRRHAPRQRRIRSVP